MYKSCWGYGYFKKQRTEREYRVMVKLLQLLEVERKKIERKLEETETEYYEGYYSGFRAGIQYCITQMQTLDGGKNEND